VLLHPRPPNESDSKRNPISPLCNYASPSHCRARNSACARLHDPFSRVEHRWRRHIDMHTVSLY
jgi:hypothetical protein